MGLRPGVSDIFVYYPNGTYHGLWLEIKRNMNYPPSAKMTPTWTAQEKFQEIVKGVGFDAHFCYGAEHAIKIIENYMT